MLNHPDKIQSDGGNEQEVEQATAKMAEINHAYQEIMKTRREREDERTFVATFLERNTPIDLLVLHCSNQNAEGIIKTLDEYRMSAHYVLGENGELIKCVDESKSAQHAFPGYWRGFRCQPELSRSIGD